MLELERSISATVNPTSIITCIMRSMYRKNHQPKKAKHAQYWVYSTIIEWFTNVGPFKRSWEGITAIFFELGDLYVSAADGETGKKWIYGRTDVANKDVTNKDGCGRER